MNNSDRSLIKIGIINVRTPCRQTTYTDVCLHGN